MCFDNTLLYKDLMFASDLPLYVAVVIVGCACLWQFRRSKCHSHPFANQNVVVVTSLAESSLATAKLKQNVLDFRVMGFDCEWVGRNKVSLLQLSTLDGLCILYRLFKLGTVPPELQLLLEDPSVLKVGVGALDDAKHLLKDYNVFVRGCLDLRHLVEDENDARGLATLTSRLLGVELEKGLHVRCSNWESEELTSSQCDYAAQDALAAVKIFDKLARIKLSRSLIGKWKCTWSTPVWNDVVNVCAMHIDVNYKFRNKKGNREETSRCTKLKVGRERRRIIMAKPLYDNCWILAPDGSRLDTCTKKKVDWYIRNNLGVLVDENPASVRLNFEPASREFTLRRLYNAQVKVNQCVVCAVKENLMRKNIVPIEYRRHFPSPLTNHSTHDILPLCITCHLKSNISDHSVRQRLQSMSFDGNAHSSNAEGQTMRTRNVKALQVKNAANALLNRPNIPQERVEVLRRTVTEYFNVSECTEEILQAGMMLEVTEVNQDFVRHGLDVVNKFTAGPGLQLLQTIWREHFVTTMKPKYLPPLWSIYFNDSDEKVTLDVQQEDEEQKEEDVDVEEMF